MRLTASRIQNTAKNHYQMSHTLTKLRANNLYEQVKNKLHINVSWFK